ncbi:uncharacterized protein V6R79_000556 [Siganus canaliculatus]
MSTFLWEDSHLLNSPQLHFQTLSTFMCGGNSGREEAAGFFLVSPGPSEDAVTPSELQSPSSQTIRVTSEPVQPVEQTQCQRM